eukprot:scaffold13594_cov88-Isochrysis_galbana.AAC.4
MTEPSPPSPHRLAPCGHPACKFGFIVVASVLGVPLSVHPRRPTANGKQKDPVSRGERRLLACNCLCASRKGSWGADQLAGAGRFHSSPLSSSLRHPPKVRLHLLREAEPHRNLFGLVERGLSTGIVPSLSRRRLSRRRAAVKRHRRHGGGGCEGLIDGCCVGRCRERGSRAASTHWVPEKRRLDAYIPRPAALCRDAAAGHVALAIPHCALRPVPLLPAAPEPRRMPRRIAPRAARLAPKWRLRPCQQSSFPSPHRGVRRGKRRWYICPRVEQQHAPVARALRRAAPRAAAVRLRAALRAPAIPRILTRHLRGVMEAVSLSEETLSSQRRRRLA